MNELRASLAGHPWENGHCETFIGKSRNELPNCEIFYTLQEAKILIENWRFEFNTSDFTAAWGNVLLNLRLVR